MNHLQRYTLLLVTMVLLLALGLSARASIANGANLWFVSRNGDNTTGQDWAGAWSELNQIRWDLVQQGDTILIDGGDTACPAQGDEPPGCGMVYNTRLAWGRDRVTVQLSSQTGRNGTAIFDGNQTVFTYCAENRNMPPPPTSPGGPLLETVVSFNGRSHATLDGTKWGGIVVRNGRQGINMGGGDFNTVRGVKVHHNNWPGDTTNNSIGIQHGWTATGNLVEQVEVYRNGQDALRVAGDNFTLRGSYIHDHYCNHPDGIQALVFTANADVPDGEGKIENLLVEGNVFERVGLQMVFLGENVGHQSWVDGAVIRDNLFLSGFFIIKSKHARSTNWQIYHNTFGGSSQFGIEWCCGGATAPMTIRDNIFQGIRSTSTGFWLPTTGGRTIFSGNCVYGSGSLGGNYTQTGTIREYALFTNPARGDYSLAADSPCAGKGASVTSKAILFGDAHATPTPTATEATTATPTSTATDSPTETATETQAPPTATPRSTQCWQLSDGQVCFIPFTPTP